MPKLALDAFQIAKISRMYTSGYTIKEISGAVKRSEYYCRKVGMSSMDYKAYRSLKRFRNLMRCRAAPTFLRAANDNN